MDGVRQYLLTIVTGAMICAIITRISSKCTANAALIKLLSQVFMLILLVSPLIKIQLSDVTAFIDHDIWMYNAVTDGEFFADTETEGIIKESVCAYILDKASMLHADIQVEVSLAESTPKVPTGVVIYGDVSPYTKTVLQTMIAKELGIPEEAQIWN